MEIKEKQYYLSIVMRYGEGSHILFWLEDGVMKKKRIYHFVNEPVVKDGILTWDVENLFEEILIGMKKCREAGMIPYSVGITGWGFDYVFLDKEGKRTGDVYHGMDRRSWGMGEEIDKIFQESEIYSMTGGRKQPFSILYQLMADKVQKPERLEKAEHLLILPDYFHYLLTGVMKSEYTSCFFPGWQTRRPVTGTGN